MQKFNRAAVRYARSLLKIGQEQNKLDAINNDILLISNTIKENRELRVALSSPVLRPDKKEKILLAIFSGKIDIITEKFVSLVCDHNRANVLASITHSFQVQYRKAMNIQLAHVKSAVALDAATQNKIIQLLSPMGSVEIENIVDPTLIGGFVVRVEDQQIDASVAQKLQDLRNSFSKNLYVSAL